MWGHHGQELGGAGAGAEAGDEEPYVRAEAAAAVAALRLRGNRKVACGTRAAYAAAGARRNRTCSVLAAYRILLFGV